MMRSLKAYGTTVLDAGDAKQWMGGKETKKIVFLLFSGVPFFFLFKKKRFIMFVVLIVVATAVVVPVLSSKNDDERIIMIKRTLEDKREYFRREMTSSRLHYCEYMYTGVKLLLQYVFICVCVYDDVLIVCRGAASSAGVLPQQQELPHWLSTGI